MSNKTIYQEKFIVYISSPKPLGSSLGLTKYEITNAIKAIARDKKGLLVHTTDISYIESTALNFANAITEQADTIASECIREYDDNR